MMLLHKQHKDPAMFMKSVNHMGLRQNLDLEVCRMAEPVLRAHRRRVAVVLTCLLIHCRKKKSLKALLMLSDPSANRWVMVNRNAAHAGNKQFSLMLKRLQI